MVTVTMRPDGTGQSRITNPEVFDSMPCKKNFP